MKIAVVKESAPGETRVALMPETLARLVRAGHQVRVQSGAGAHASASDDVYGEAGGEVAVDAAAAIEGAQVVLCVQAPGEEVLSRLPRGAVLIGQFQARQSGELMDRLSSAGITTFSMEMVPRIARAQRLDVLSSQASLAGYKAVLLAANRIGKFFPLMMTAAGTIPPANVLVLGAGVAGLQAIATAKRLGAKVAAFDVRAVVREQVESLGATFVDIAPPEDAETAGGYAAEQTAEEQARQRAALAEHVAKADVVITTAQIPGRPAPLLIEAPTVERMAPGSVIVDLAAESGGNCEVTVAGEEVDHGGVFVLGPRNVPGMMPAEASLLFSRNVLGLIELITGDEAALTLNFDDEVVAGTAVTHDGRLVGALGEGGDG